MITSEIADRLSRRPIERVAESPVGQQIGPPALAYSDQSGANSVAMTYGWTSLSATDVCHPMVGVVQSCALSANNHRALGCTVVASVVNRKEGIMVLFRAVFKGIEAKESRPGGT